MTQIKPNRRAHKTINKTYRFFKTDIWGHLGKKLHDKKVTNIVATQARIELKMDLRKYPRKLVKNIKKYFRRSRKKNQKKTERKPADTFYQLTKKPKQKKLRQRALRNSLLKLRKKLSLFYGGGKIRSKTFRRFAKLVVEQGRAKTLKLGPNSSQTYINYNDYTKFLESRLDVLLLRSSFLTTIYMIRQAIVHRKVKVFGQKHINHPGFLVKTFREFTISRTYARYSNRFLDRVKKISYLALKPNYIWVNFAALIGFKIKEPNAKIISYPFRLPIRSQLVFKFGFFKH